MPAPDTDQRPDNPAGPASPADAADPPLEETEPAGTARADRARALGRRWPIRRPPVGRPQSRSAAPPISAQQGCRFALSVLAVLAGAALTGCDRGTDTPAPSGSARSVPRATPPAVAKAVDPATAGRQAIAAYRGMWRVYEAAVAIPEPDTAALSRFTSGPALSRLSEGLQAATIKGLKGTGTVRLSPAISSAAPAAAPTEVEITDCMDTSRWRLVRASGDPYTDSPGGHRLVVATVKQTSPGGWKVDQLTINQVGTC